MFNQLQNVLNLSSNNLSRAEAKAFYVLSTGGDDDGAASPLRLREIDLANNSFALPPWKSLRQLPDLTILRLSRNPIEYLGAGDLDFVGGNKFVHKINIFSTQQFIKARFCS